MVIVDIQEPRGRLDLLAQTPLYQDLLGRLEPRDLLEQIQLYQDLLEQRDLLEQIQ